MIVTFPFGRGWGFNWSKKPEPPGGVKYLGGATLFGEGALFEGAGGSMGRRGGGSNRTAPGWRPKARDAASARRRPLPLCPLSSTLTSRPWTGASPTWVCPSAFLRPVHHLMTRCPPPPIVGRGSWRALLLVVVAALVDTDRRKL